MNPYSIMSGANPLSTTSNIGTNAAFQNLSASPERKNKPKKLPDPAINNFNSTQNATAGDSINLANQAKEENPSAQASIGTGVETSPEKPFRKSTIFNHLLANQQNQKMNQNNLYMAYTNQQKLSKGEFNQLYF